MNALDTLCIDTIRTLSMDAVQNADSGHPGAPMALAPVGHTLWTQFLNYDPKNPRWPNRDRFVLSNGHASMLLYSLLHLAGVEETNVPHPRAAVTLEAIKNFRKLGSPTAGHPESHLTAGVETTTGPLGQGLANAVGMAIAGKWLEARFNRPGYTLFHFDVYALCGDGCLMEGISSEAASLAGHLKLDNLCWIYDDNSITIEGKTSLAFSEDVPARFRSCGWNVLEVNDANDTAALAKAFMEFQSRRGAPTLIVVKSKIAYGSPNKEGSHSAHGEPLGQSEIQLTKKAYGWPESESFRVPDGVRDHYAVKLGARGSELRKSWEERFTAYKKEFPELGTQLEAILKGELPSGWDRELPTFSADAKGMATRESSGKTLNAIAKNLPWLLGGSADLAPSTKTKLTFDDAGVFSATSPGGRNFHFGVREHAMGAILNGMALTGLRAYGSGFLIFSDYGKTPIRLAALMNLPVLYVFTHDSIGVGEDGPTHQPIEQLVSLRAVPGLYLFRPADAAETVEAYRFLLGVKDRPAALALTRQAVPTFDRNQFAAASGVARGAYVLADSPRAAGANPGIILIGTGSEVALCVEAYTLLRAEGIDVRVVSMPSWERFEEQDESYRESVLPAACTARIAVEAGSPIGWDRYAGPKGVILAMRSFGASANLKALLPHFGFTAGAIVAAAKKFQHQ